MASDKPFQTRVYGKFILAGEHAVLRGCPALVFPVFGKHLDLQFDPSSETLRVRFREESGKDVGLVFWSLVERALTLLSKNRSDLTGLISIENNIPVGAGLGASAALCVAVARFCEHSGWLKTYELQDFARSLEDLFHGESSGVDVAVALSGSPMWFERRGERRPIAPLWKPNWYLSYCGQRGMTSDCIETVKRLWTRSRSLGEEIDHEMRLSVEEAYESLFVKHNTDSAFDRFEQLAQSLRRARSCFERWGLTEGALEHHMTHLMSLGAAAVKPTGSGGGGYVLSLWPPGEEPTQARDLIRL